MPSLTQPLKYLAHPLDVVRSYDRRHLRDDFIAGLTVGVIMLPQAIAFTLIAELPPQMGLYAAVVGAIVGALWGSSRQIQTGPANAIALLTASVLSVVADPGSALYIQAAGLVAIMAGVLQVVLGLARLGMLVNFVSYSVIVGFTAGAGVLIAVKQVRPLLGLHFQSANIVQTLLNILTHLPDTHPPTAAIGLGSIVLILLVRRLNRRLPAPLIAMIVASGLVLAFHLEALGVEVVGDLPRSLPPLTIPPLRLDLISELSTGALAIAAIGLVSAAAIGQALSNQTGQRIDNNQEFVGQGLANIAAGLFSGYPVAASFSRSAVNLEAGAKSPFASIFAGLFMLVAIFVLTPFVAFVPMAALAGVLMVTAYNLIDFAEIRRIARGARGDAVILFSTLLGTIFLRLEFAVLLGILLSFAHYIIKTSAPVVHAVIPDPEFRRLVQDDSRPQCPQLGILDIHGDLYFGAVNHIEEAIERHLAEHPSQRFLLLRMHTVNVADFSGIHMLERLVEKMRAQGGDVYLTYVRRPLLRVLESTKFLETIGEDHILWERTAIHTLFYHALDPNVCIYECPVRVFRECQNLPRSVIVDTKIAERAREVEPVQVPAVDPATLWDLLHTDRPPLVVDVREPREFRRGHIPGALLVPLSHLLAGEVPDLPHDRTLVLVCRMGRRSPRAAALLQQYGYTDLLMLEGGMLAWEAANLLEAFNIADVEEIKV